MLLLLLLLPARPLLVWLLHLSLPLFTNTVINAASVGGGGGAAAAPLPPAGFLPSSISFITPSEEYCTGSSNVMLNVPVFA